MQFSRRSFLGALGAGSLAGLAGCAGVPGVDEASAVLNRPGPPEGAFPSTLGASIHEPGRCVDIEHQLVEARNLVGLREHRTENQVASGLLEFPEGKAESGFDLDPESVEAYARFRPTLIFTGSFSRADLLASFRDDDWAVTERHAGFDVLEPPENPWYYAAGVGDGIFVTTNRYREVPPTEFVKAHAEAVAGDTSRYGGRSDMQNLLSVVGGGDYVTAITSPVDLGDEPPATRALGRSLAVADNSVVVTGAFLFDESAPGTPEELAEEWLGEIPPWAEPSTEIGSAGRVGYFSTTIPESEFDTDGNISNSVREGDPAVSMQDRLDQRYTEANRVEAPDATFVARTLDETADVDCGASEGQPIEVTYRSGPDLAPRRLRVVDRPNIYPVLGCGYELGDTISTGDTITVSSQSGSVDMLWQGPHGSTQWLTVTMADE